MPEATIKQIKDYFGFTDSREFLREWKELSDDDKRYFKEAVGQELEAV